MAVACYYFWAFRLQHTPHYLHILYVLRTFYTDAIYFISIYPYIDLISCTSSLIGTETHPQPVDTSATCGGYTAGTKQPI
jgi:hypothetical protein